MFKKGLYLKWPKKRLFHFRWKIIHSVILIVLLIHLAVIVIIKNIITQSVPTQRVLRVNIDMVKPGDFRILKAKEKVNFLKKKKLTPETDKKKVKTSDRGQKKKDSRDSHKARSLSKKADAQKIEQKVKISLPGADYPQVQSIPGGKIQRISPTGRPGGSYDEYRITYTPRSEGTGGNSRGRSDGQGLPGPEGEREIPWVLWDYKFKVGRTVNYPMTIQESFKYYLAARDADPFLVGAVVPFSREVDKLGVGSVRFIVTIPAVDNQPEEGVHPIDIKVLEVNPRNPDMREEMEKIAIVCVQRSLWYPAKMGGQTVTKDVEFTLRFYGKEGKKN
ncbi:MAG: hypothetical protein K8T10_12620 [Candidatus Eremiobacteraeota bacterium]|nr:hypothetical protein [Candidatus Eremiobacteraeota bacterium]